MRGGGGGGENEKKNLRPGEEIERDPLPESRGRGEGAGAWLTAAATTRPAVQSAAPGRPTRVRRIHGRRAPGRLSLVLDRSVRRTAHRRTPVVAPLATTEPSRARVQQPYTTLLLRTASRAGQRRPRNIELRFFPLLLL